MPDHLCISVRFLDGAFHGRADQGEPEWPPSPLRLFQALVAASAARWNERRVISHAAPALRWFESLPPPQIVAPATIQAATTGYRLYVPDNVGDLVGSAWTRGRDASIADYRTEKSVRPTRIADDEGALHYLWPLTAAASGLGEHRDTLLTAARSITHLGWGIDLVVAEASVLSEAEVARLPGQRWTPADDEAASSLRVPCTGTFDELTRRHHAFLNRIQGDGFAPVPPLASYALAHYRSDTEPPRAPYAVFALRQLDDSGYRAFDPVRRGLHVAGMLRHTASQPELARSLGWSEAEAARLVLGHSEARGETHYPVAGPRFALMPLPSIEWRGDERKFSVGSIRRVLVSAVGTADRDSFNRFVRQLNGQELIDAKTKEPAAVLVHQTGADSVAQRYIQESSTWASVTPVILPGYDDPRKLRKRLSAANTTPLTAEEKNELIRKLDTRIDHLLRKAILQSGIPETLARHADLDWRSTGFWPGAELVSHYAVPDQHRRFRRLHVRITWRTPDGQPLKVAGPICLGGGKHTGLGLFAAHPTEL